jgi:hypothetical protein
VALGRRVPLALERGASFNSAMLKMLFRLWLLRKIWQFLTRRNRDPRRF